MATNPEKQIRDIRDLYYRQEERFLEEHYGPMVNVAVNEALIQSWIPYGVEVNLIHAEIKGHPKGRTFVGREYVHPHLDASIRIGAVDSLGHGRGMIPVTQLVAHMPATDGHMFLEVDTDIVGAVGYQSDKLTWQSFVTMTSISGVSRENTKLSLHWKMARKGIVHRQIYIEPSNSEGVLVDTSPGLTFWHDIKSGAASYGKLLLETVGTDWLMLNPFAAIQYTPERAYALVRRMMHDDGSLGSGNFSSSGIIAQIGYSLDHTK